MSTADMAKLSFKVYLLDNESTEQKEVRRFGIDADVAANFVYLREKLQTIFPTLRGKCFIVTWKDGEDSITISTNEELEIALEEMSRETVNKLYIILESGRETPRTERAEKILHYGIVCDVCDKNICGFRFKCMQCPDYDLCTDCIVLGYHPEHYMMRLTEPVDLSHHDIRRLSHHMRKFAGAMKKASSSSHNSKDDETRRCSYRSGGKRGNCPVFSSTAGGKVGFDPSVVDSLENFVKSMSVLFEDSSQEQKRSRDQQREPSTEAATEATEDPRQEATRHSFSQLLKIFENNISNISQFLDPLGINVVLTADDDTSAKNDKPTADKAEPEATSAPSTSDTTKKFPGEGKRLCDDSKTEKTTIIDEASSSTPPKKTVSPKQSLEDDDWSEVEYIDIPHSSSNSSIVNGAVPKEVTPPASSASSAPSAPPAPSASTTSAVEPTASKQIYPSLPTQEFFHPNPKIQQAVEAMMSMGFSNEGGWLTHLLASKGGDISKALDVLQPVRFNK